MTRKLLTDFELMILLAILRLDDAYGVSIAREIEATAGRKVMLGAVYAALARLEQQALVTSSLGEPMPQRGGRARQHFKLTGTGLRAVKDTRRALVALWKNVPQLEGGVV
jgi:DNA-binding PadR family transcriptional regulator